MAGKSGGFVWEPKKSKMLSFAIVAGFMAFPDPIWVGNFPNRHHPE